LPIRVLASTAALVLALGVAPAALAKGPPKRSSRVVIVTRVHLIFRLGAPQAKDRSHSCAKGARRSKAHPPGSAATWNLARKAVVACEQPPRSKPITLGGAKHAEAVLGALVG